MADIKTFVASAGLVCGLLICPPASAAICTATTTLYSTLLIGMTVDEVTKVMGCEGRDMPSPASAAGQPKTLIWEGKQASSKLTAVFQDGTLAEKSQAGLESASSDGQGSEMTVPVPLSLAKALTKRAMELKLPISFRVSYCEHFDVIPLMYCTISVIADKKEVGKFEAHFSPNTFALDYFFLDLKDFPSAPTLDGYSVAANILSNTRISPDDFARRIHAQYEHMLKTGTPDAPDEQRYSGVKELVRMTEKRAIYATLERDYLSLAPSDVSDALSAYAGRGAGVDFSFNTTSCSKNPPISCRIAMEDKDGVLGEIAAQFDPGTSGLTGFVFSSAVDQGSPTLGGLYAATAALSDRAIDGSDFSESLSDLMQKLKSTSPAEKAEFGDVVLNASKADDKITITLSKSRPGLVPTSVTGQGSEMTGPDPLNIAQVLTKRAAEMRLPVRFGVSSCRNAQSTPQIYCEISITADKRDTEKFEAHFSSNTFMLNYFLFDLNDYPSVAALEGYSVAANVLGNSRTSPDDVARRIRDQYKHMLSNDDPDEKRYDGVKQIVRKQDRRAIYATLERDFSTPTPSDISDALSIYAGRAGLDYNFSTLSCGKEPPAICNIAMEGKGGSLGEIAAQFDPSTSQLTGLVFSLAADQISSTSNSLYVGAITLGNWGVTDLFGRGRNGPIGRDVDFTRVSDQLLEKLKSTGQADKVQYGGITLSGSKVGDKLSLALSKN